MPDYTTDDPEGLTLDVDHAPTIEPGDELLVFPDVGRAYRAEVLCIDLDRERVKVRIPHDPRAPRPTGSETRWFCRDELEAAHVNADLMINPPEQPEGPA